MHPVLSKWLSTLQSFVSWQSWTAALCAYACTGGQNPSITVYKDKTASWAQALWKRILVFFIWSPWTDVNRMFSYKNHKQSACILRIFPLEGILDTVTDSVTTTQKSLAMRVCKQWRACLQITFVADSSDSSNIMKSYEITFRKTVRCWDSGTDTVHGSWDVWDGNLALDSSQNDILQNYPVILWTSEARTINGLQDELSSLSKLSQLQVQKPAMDLSRCTCRVVKW